MPTGDKIFWVGLSFVTVGLFIVMVGLGTMLYQRAFGPLQ